VSSFQHVVLLVRIGLAGLAFLGFSLGSMLVASIVLPIARWRHRTAPRFEQAAACQRWIRRGFVFLHDYMRWCRLIHFDHRVVEVPAPSQPYVIVANHPTLVDVSALVSVFGRLTCVAKTPLFRSPITGSILRSCAYLDGGDGGLLASALVVPQALERLNAGMPVLVFPEGTRSPPDGLHPFKRGAFEIACRANVDVLPVLIRCDPPALGKGRPWYDIPKRASSFTITPLPAMRPSEFAGDASMMAASCEATCRRHLGLPPTPPRRTSNAHE
jgi:1-acyl-sn-glycerol-3-phosphate acyltransferase